MSLNSYTITSNEHNERLDKVLTALSEDASRAQVQVWIKDQHVTVNDSYQKSNYKCQEGDLLSWEVPEPEPMEVLAEDIPLDIVYEDQDVIVVNKPKGMVVHPSAGHNSGTLVNALLYHCQDLSGINGVMRPGIVHRIDKDTSGLLMVAKNDKAHTSLAEQLSDKSVERKYVALVSGVIHHEYGTIDAPIGRDPKDRQKMGVVEGGKNAVTHFKVLDRFEEHTLVECVLETGRTHQIRVHMNYIEHPIVGDPKYGPRKTLDLNGQALHAKELGFTHPSTGEYLHFNSELPVELEQVLVDLTK
ncbi:MULTISPECIES: RluA family pseudouridine synthase [Pontibacillus]|uniref:Pseudouridine synthase n=1 Tax=Pontibacillus chungwhensis TaxID=265426 RepID=A0ABY8V5M8_9BACI|nr:MULTISPECIES: RluA family pseudouridine synthase [Pontibacillus]MCD5322611.1 RluA family pseudouridine synthase [Pontibacillus sp. HN14]WIF99894.1 RluA family pseudouridine synthase [Pontibacillus chungwhensis]